MRESAALLILSTYFPEPFASRVRYSSLAELCQIGRVLEAFGGKCPTLEELLEAAAPPPVVVPPPPPVRHPPAPVARRVECRDRVEVVRVCHPVR